jgi:hypothetical protein
VKVYPPGKPKSTHLYGDSYPLWERLATRALVAVVVGRDYRCHIHRAKVAARRAEFEQDFELAHAALVRRARI